MKWYLAKLVYRIVCGDGQHIPQFDEQLRLVAAPDAAAAFDKAVAMGGAEEDSFCNQNAQWVHWQFINVSELCELRELIDGAEVYSRIREEEDGTAYTTFVHNKAAAIRENQTHGLLQLI
ncbi:MAG: hypothetical protein JWP27_2268 [Flaviaesturariibacter sp.]|nr:hypothetical protein [Flaviaesturariibacter sp.]